MEDVLSLAHHFFPPAAIDNYYRGSVTSEPKPVRPELLKGMTLPVHEVRVCDFVGSGQS